MSAIYNLQYLSRVDSAAIRDAAKMYNGTSDMKMEIRSIGGAYILPDKDLTGGVISESGAYYDSSYFSRGLSRSRWVSKESANYRDEPVLYVGMFNYVWGHCFTDDIKMFWFLLDSGAKEKFDSMKWVYTSVGNNKEMPEYFKWILDRLGIGSDRLEHISEDTFFTDVYLPDECFMKAGQYHTIYTKEYLKLVEKITDGIVPDSSRKKIYLSESSMKSKKNWGIRRIERAFKKNGYTVVNPQDFSIEQQIAIYEGCEAMASTEGSISHNAIFVKEGCSVTLVRKFRFINRYQMAINDMRSLNVTYIDANLSNMPFCGTQKQAGPFFLFVNAGLARMLHTIPFFPVIHYLLYCLHTLKWKVKCWARGIDLYKTEL